MKSHAQSWHLSGKLTRYNIYGKQTAQFMQPLLRGKPTQTTIESNKNMSQRQIRDQYGNVLFITKSLSCGEKPHK